MIVQIQVFLHNIDFVKRIEYIIGLIRPATVIKSVLYFHITCLAGFITVLVASLALKQRLTAAVPIVDVIGAVAATPAAQHVTAGCRATTRLNATTCRRTV